MHCVGSTSLRPVFFSLPTAPVLSSLRCSCWSLKASSLAFSRSIPAPPTHFQPRRACSTTVHSHNDLFNYTSGQWIYNNALRHAERKRVFNVDGLCRLAAEAVNRSPNDVHNLEKLAEGGFNRIFLITMRDGFQMVARIPYPITVPKYYAVASEAATMAFLRSFGLPIPEVYGYSPVPDNVAGTEYIFMEFVRGTKLSDVWFDLGDRDIASVLHQFAGLESKMMSVSLPAGGSLYYTHDLEKRDGISGIPLVEKERFCVGPDVRLPLWFGRRSLIDVNRGPHITAEETLVNAAHKELAYLEQFGEPLLPLERIRRETYQYKKQSPLDHIENLKRYLLIAFSHVPKDPTLRHFRIRHPDLHPSNIIVSKSPDSSWQVTGLLDWQHASILPMFLLAGIPQRLQNYGDPVSESMTQPALPKNLDDLDEAERLRAKRLYHRRLVHYHYVKATEECNELHYTALKTPMGVLRRRLFHHASDLWDGETLELKVALVEAVRHWEALTGGGVPCPIGFDAEDVSETVRLEKVQEGADETVDAIRNMIGCGLDGWVPTECYGEAITCTKELKEAALAAATSAAERSEITEHWIFDGIDEEKYA